MKTANKKWRTTLVKGDRRDLEALLNSGHGPKNYWLHQMMAVDGGFVLVWKAKSVGELFYERQQAAKKRRLEKGR